MNWFGFEHFWSNGSPAGVTHRLAQIFLDLLLANLKALEEKGTGAVITHQLGVPDAAVVVAEYASSMAAAQLAT